MVTGRIGHQEIVYHALADPAVVLANLSDLLIICHAGKNSDENL